MALYLNPKLISDLTGIDFVQEKFMGAGAQDNESAIEQAKDEQISDYSMCLSSYFPPPSLFNANDDFPQFEGSISQPQGPICQSRTRRLDLVEAMTNL